MDLVEKGNLSVWNCAMINVLDRPMKGGYQRIQGGVVFQ
jgi:hypothetical protein